MGSAEGARKAQETMRARGQRVGRPRKIAAVEPAGLAAVADDLLGRRVTVPLTDDGRIDWDRMPAAQRDQVDSAVRREVPGATPEPAAALVDDAIVGMLYDAISSVGVTIARAAGYSVDTAALMKIQAEEKAALVPMTNKVLAKYSGVLGAYQDEIMLSVCLGSILMAKVSAMRAAEPMVGGGAVPHKWQAAAGAVS